MNTPSGPEETQAAPTESFHTLPTASAFENVLTWPLLGNDLQRLDYRMGMLESAWVQEHQQGGPTWQPYALGVAGIACIVVGALAIKDHVSKEVVIGGLVLVGLLCLVMAATYSTPTPGPAQAGA